MKAVIQRVVNASVAVDGQTISSIGKGLLVLVGIDKNDEPSDSTTIIKKILNAKLFGDESGDGWKKNVQDIDGEVLCVSQFTLFATFKGSKPDFHDSMSTIPGKAFYTSFLEEIRAAYRPDRIKGQLSSRRAIRRHDGPVTVLLSSRDKPFKSGSSTPNQADEARQKQKDLAEAKARKREAAEARVKEKEQMKRKKEEEWQRRKADKATTTTTTDGQAEAGLGGAVEGLSLQSKST